MGKVMKAGRCSKTVAFVAILALTTFGALATASAQRADIKAIDKAFKDHYARENYPAAQIDAQELERLVKARFGADHAYYAVALNRLGIVCWWQGKYTEAEGLFKRALAIREKALGAKHPDVGQTLNNLALVYGAQAKYTEAEGLFKRALAIREKALGANHPDVGRSLNNLANVYRAQGKYSEAEGLCRRALAIHEKALGAGHPGVADTLNLLAGVYQAQGKYSEAERLFERALAIREKARGVGHPDVARAVNNLALMYRDQGKDPSPLIHDLLLRMPPVPPGKVVIRDGPGGLLSEANMRWVGVGQSGDEVEIRGLCQSACTLVMSRVPAKRICFDLNGSLAFHLARDKLSKPDEMPIRWERNDSATKWLVDSYPADIRAWIDARGGYLKLPYDGHWVIRAPELWAMGYRRCPD
jgi:tetratricopeptide (TPR) repeat protein